MPGDTRITCTACAGTLLLEFGVLSRLTGNATYEAKARRAVETIHAMRRWVGVGFLGGFVCVSPAELATRAGEQGLEGGGSCKHSPSVKYTVQCEVHLAPLRHGLYTALSVN